MQHEPRAGGPVESGRQEEERPQHNDQRAGGHDLSAKRSVVELRLPSEPTWERPAVELVASVARRLGFPAPRIEDIKTAVAEAIMNAIEHGNALDPAREVIVELVSGERSLEVRVRDQSEAPFTPPPSAPAPSLQDRIEGRTSARGWGIFLIARLVDEVEYQSTDSGNLVRMVIHLDRDHDQQDPPPERCTEE